MSSKRDLVEAHSFNRRRLITAFVSGAPGGREVEPVRYGRTLVGGLVLAVLLVAGAAVSGYLKPTVPKDWLKDNGVVIGKTSGSRFVAFGGTLYPVINTTSARLVLAGGGSLTPKTIPDDRIAAAPQGLTIGIPGAPDVLPTPSHLLESGWVACTNQAGGVRLTVAGTPGADAAPGKAFLVRARGEVFVIAGRYRYPLPRSQDDAVLRALQLDGQPVRDVPGRWLDLVDEGAPLRPFTVEGQGTTVDTGVDGLTRVGTPFLVDDRPYVLVARDRIQQITDFAYQVYRAYGPGAGFGDELRVSSTDVTSLRTVDADSPPYPSSWPDQAVSAYGSIDAPCLLLRAARDQAPSAELATATTDTAAASGNTVSRSVPSGYGAVVRASTAGVLGAGAAYLVDASGTAYAVGDRGNDGQSLAALGYGKVQPVPVPQAWVDLFASGPQLTTAAAGRESTAP